MNDMPQWMSDELDAVLAKLKKIATQHDSKLVAAAMSSQGAKIYSALLAANKITMPQLTEIYVELHNAATAESPPPTERFIGG